MRAVVEAPALCRAKHGLVDSFGRANEGRWENGVTFTPRGCNAVFGYVADCPSEDKSDFQECGLVEADAWLIETGLVWASMDLAANPKELVREALDVGTSSVLERLTSSGVTDVAVGTPVTAVPPAAAIGTGGVTGRVMGGAQAPPTLVGTALTVAAGDAISALGHVEAKLIDSSDHTGGCGTIMMSPVQAVQVWGSLLEDENGNLYTRATGARVVVGNFEPGTIWGVTGLVDVYLSDIEIFEAFTGKSNEYAVRAERFALAVWNCQAFGATVPAPAP